MAVIPRHHRPALREVLDALVAGEPPTLKTWIDAYGRSGARLVRQPDAIWDHPRSECHERADGSVYVVVPLWTMDESPSDLSAECEITRSGSAAVSDVHVL